MRVLICGDRNWTDETAIWTILDGLTEEDRELPTIIEGCANGADNIAHRYYGSDSNHHLHFPADWRLFGAAAGPNRNERMLREGRPDIVYGFHDDIAKSKGTHDMLVRASRAGVPTYLVSHFS